ncbi:MED18 (predicted) [Pycnogonum litorale]
MVRARRAIDHPGVPWHLRYVGQPEAGDKNRPTIVSDVATSENLVQFLNEMGFRLDHEFILKGYMFRKGRMKITVSKIFRMLQPGSSENVEPVTLSYLVELSVVVPSGQEAIADEMKAFSEQFKPYPHSAHYLNFSFYELLIHKNFHNSREQFLLEIV